jgi:hypothetical protein
LGCRSIPFRTPRNLHQYWVKALCIPFMACYPSLGKGRRGYVRGFWQNRNHGDCSSESLCPACVEISSVHGSMVPAGMKSTNSTNPLLNARILGVSPTSCSMGRCPLRFRKNKRIPSPGLRSSGVNDHLDGVQFEIQKWGRTSVFRFQCSVWHCCFLCFVFCVLCFPKVHF